jgi:hypothetical protein
VADSGGTAGPSCLDGIADIADIAGVAGAADIADIAGIAGAADIAGIAVAFAGPGSGTGPLTWGQRQIWAAMRATDSSQSLRAVLPLPSGKTADDLAAELGFFMSRYESLRSRLDPGTDGVLPTQTVAASGRAALSVLDVADDADPAAVAEALADYWERTEFDYCREWPMRLAAVRHRGVATHVVVVLSHLAADGGGVAVMMDDLAAWDPATDPLAVPPAGPGPLELAGRQATRAAGRQSDSALKYWDGLLRAAPPMRFPPTRPDGGPRFRQLTLESPALLPASRVVAGRTGGAVSPVLLAAYAVALARATGVNPVLSQVIVGNRFRPGLAGAVHPVSQNGLVRLDVGGTTFDGAVERAARASVSGSKHAYYDPAACDLLRERVDRELGIPVEIGCVFNDRRAGSGSEFSGPPPSVEEIRAVIPGHDLRWGTPLPLFNERLMVTVDGSAESLTVLIEVDTHALSASAAESFLLTMESAVLDAAFDPEAGTGVFRA